MKHVSASQITTFRDCPRKWYFNKIVGLETPSTPATELGSAVHQVLENYLRDGVDFPSTEAGEIARSGAHLLPDDQHVEIELSLDEMPLADSPIKVAGFIDALYPQRHQILDHKTSSNKRYTKTRRELRENVQLILYARAYIDRAVDAESVLLTHIYYGTRSRWSKRVEVSLTRAEILEKWATIRADIEEMMRVSTLPNAGEVSPNRATCDKYGGCPFAGKCFRAHAYQPAPKQPKTTNSSGENNMMTPEERMRQLGLAPPTPQTPAKTAPSAPVRSAPSNERTLYIGCIPLKGGAEITSALDAYHEPVRALCSSFNVPHLALVDYGKGWSALVGAVSEMGWPDGVSALYLDPISKEYEHLVSVLSSLADVVIKRL